MQILDQPQQEQYPQQFLPPVDSGLQPAPPADDFFRFRISGTDILEELQHQLRGEVKKKGEWVQMFDRWMNDEGVNKVSHIVYSTGLNKNIFLGNLTHEQINMRCKGLWMELARLFTFEKDYGKLKIKKEDRRMIIRSIIYQIHSGLSRSEEGKESDQISVAASRQEIFHEGLKEKQPSMLNPVNWMKRGR